MNFDLKTSKNLILQNLSEGDAELLKPHLLAVELPVRRQLEVRNRQIEHVYFLERGLASVVLSAGSNHSIEVCIIGREGVTGHTVILESDKPVHECFIQSEGHGWRLPTDALVNAIAKSPTLRTVLIHFVNAMLCQMAFTALANGRYSLQERLARWLVMAHDRAEGDELFLTHEFLSLMLGTRRPGVTNCLNSFEKKGFISTSRSKIQVIDRQGLVDAANGSYGAPEAEYLRIMGSPITGADPSL